MIVRLPTQRGGSSPIGRNSVTSSLAMLAEVAALYTNKIALSHVLYFYLRKIKNLLQERS